MTVDPETARAKVDFQDRTFYFCCQGCATKFSTNPATFIVESRQIEIPVQSAAPPAKLTDPVCGMTVEPETAKTKVDFQEGIFYFCCQGCATKFSANPAAYIEPRQIEQRVQRSSIEQVSADGYTCPMHAEVHSATPGDCPSCGMPLEAVLPSATDDNGASEVREISRHLSWSAALTFPLVLVSMTHMPGMGQSASTGYGVSHLLSCWVQFVLATPIVLWAAMPFFRRGWSSIINHNLNMFTLLSLGIGIPYVFSAVSLLAVTLMFPQAAEQNVVYFESAAVIATLAWVGQWLEARARLRSTGAVRELVGLMPSTATVILANGTEKIMPVSDMSLPVKVRVRPGERVSVDGSVIDGISSVDESMLTGEPMPVLKQSGSQVSAGSINGNGSLVIQAERLGRDTLLSQIVQLVSQAQRTRVPIQQLADKVAAVFVPFVVLIALVTLGAWLIAGVGLAQAVTAAVTVLVVACPCALGLATPMSIVVATGRAAKAGVLFKEARSLQLLAEVDTLVIDKTGTLTQGTPRLVNLVTVNASKQELLAQAASLESYSEHPLAAAVVAASADAGASKMLCEGFVSTPGGGVSGMVSGRMVAVGSPSYLEGFGIDCSDVRAQTSENPGTSVFVAIDGNCEGRLDFADEIRSNAASALASIQRRGIRVVMATGDSHQAAQTIATVLGITEVHAAMLPADKASLVKTLQSKGAKVAMAGDGINDAPALVQANVGIAMATGTDIAMESADIVLMRSDVEGIVRAHKVSRAMVRNIAQNLVLAFGYNLVTIPLATGMFAHVLGFAVNPMVAAVAMSVSSVLVIVNALRLRSLVL
jgi:Cu+-exporting ATPase